MVKGDHHTKPVCSAYSQETNSAKAVSDKLMTSTSECRHSTSHPSTGVHSIPALLWGQLSSFT